MAYAADEVVSMKSGLEDRNNNAVEHHPDRDRIVSMKSGLEDRNNGTYAALGWRHVLVSMKSGLEDRNNNIKTVNHLFTRGLNEVRPGRPEQSDAERKGLGNTVDVSMKSGLEDRNNPSGSGSSDAAARVSMKSGLEDRNNHNLIVLADYVRRLSQ